MEGITPTLICSYRPARQPFHPTLVRPVFDKVRVVHTLCPREHPLQIFVQTILQVDTCPHEDHGHKRKRKDHLIAEVILKHNLEFESSNFLRCITFEMEIEVTFEKLEDSISSNAVEFLEAHKPSIKAKLFDWPRRDSDVALVDFSVSTEQLKIFDGRSLGSIKTNLQLLKKNFPNRNVITWKYNPFHESTVGDAANSETAKKGRLSAILASTSYKFLRQAAQEGAPVPDFKVLVSKYINFWFWKWLTYSKLGLTLIQTLSGCDSASPDQKADLKERIKQILSLLLNVVKLFQETAINTLSECGLEKAVEQHVQEYNRILMSLESALQSDLEDIPHLVCLLKEDPIKQAIDCLLAEPITVATQLHKQYQHHLTRIQQTKQSWSASGSSDSILIHHPLDQIMGSVFIGCLRGTDPKPKGWQLWNGPERTLYNETSQFPNCGGKKSAHHPDYFFSVQDQLLLHKIPCPDLQKELDKPTSNQLGAFNCSPESWRISFLSNRLLISGKQDSLLSFWSTDPQESFLKIQQEDFKLVPHTNENPTALQSSKENLNSRLVTHNTTMLVEMVNIPTKSSDFAFYCCTVPSPTTPGEPALHSALLCLPYSISHTGPNLILQAVDLNKSNQFFTFALEEQSGPNKLLMTGHLTAFKLKEANLDLCFSTKIELECPKGAREGIVTKKSSRFFTAHKRTFFSFSLTSQMFALYTVYRGNFHRVSGGKVTDDPASPVYNYPAMTSMLESRDKRGQPGSSLYLSRQNKNRRSKRGEFVIYRLRVKL